jgi:hypothetical protein
LGGTPNWDSCWMRANAQLDASATSVVDAVDGSSIGT